MSTFYLLCLTVRINLFCVLFHLCSQQPSEEEIQIKSIFLAKEYEAYRVYISCLRAPAIKKQNNTLKPMLSHNAACSQRFFEGFLLFAMGVG